MAKWHRRSFEHEINPLPASGWLNFFRQKIRGFQWSQHDNADYFESFEKILQVLNTTNERACGMVTWDFSEDAYRRNESNEITLSMELQDTIVNRLKELLAQPRWEKVWTQKDLVLPTLETVLSQIEISETRTKDQWITHFCLERIDIQEKLFEKIVKQATRIVVAKTKNGVSERKITARITNAHYRMEWENITMSTHLVEKIFFLIEQTSANRAQARLERPATVALAQSLRSLTSLTMDGYIVERRRTDWGFTLTWEIWDMIWNSSPQWFDKIKKGKKWTPRYELKVSSKPDFESFVHQLISAVTSVLPVPDNQLLGWVSSLNGWKMQDLIRTLSQSEWRQIAWRRTTGTWVQSWADVLFPSEWRRIWKKWPSDGNDD